MTNTGTALGGTSPHSHHASSVSLSLSSPRGLDYSTTWRDRYEAARNNLSSSLNLTHPVMPRLLALWEEQACSPILDLSDIRY